MTLDLYAIAIDPGAYESADFAVALEKSLRAEGVGYVVEYEGGRYTVLHSIVRSIARDALVRVAMEGASAVAAYAAIAPRPLRHRRGRGISKSAKRRRARAWGRPALHIAAARAWSAVAHAASAVLEEA